MNTAKKLMLVMRGSGAVADTAASFTATTTGAETLTILQFTVSASTTVDWGDGSTNAYTGAGARTHNYAGAGTWTVRILEPLNVTVLDIRDTKINGDIGAGISKMINLITLTIISLSSVTWTVGASAPMPTGLTSIRFFNLSGITWAVGASAPMPTGLTSLNLTTMPGITWTVGASAPMPTGLTSLNIIALSGVTIVSTLSACLALITVQIENNLSDAQQNTILAQLYAAFPTRTGTNGTIDLLGGGNAVSGGVLGPACPPITTREFGDELVNDSCGVSANHWASASLQM